MTLYSQAACVAHSLGSFKYKQCRGMMRSRGGWESMYKSERSIFETGEYAFPVVRPERPKDLPYGSTHIATEWAFKRKHVNHLQNVVASNPMFIKHSFDKF